MNAAGAEGSCVGCFFQDRAKPAIASCLDERRIEPMEHWGIYFAYGWLATLILAFTDAVQAIRKGPDPQPSSEPDIHN